MFISKIDNILSRDELSRINKLITSGRFVDGRISAVSATNKNNLELAGDAEEYIQVLGIVEPAVRENLEFNMTAFPRYMTRPIISRYETGMYYKDHVDSPVMGFASDQKMFGRGLKPIGQNYVRSDLSMTLFLNDPDTYDGGELTFNSQAGTLRIKLSAGSAIVYPTGSRHSVAPITRGVRYAAIFWIQSMFPTESHRQAVYDARRLLKALQAITNNTEVLDLAQDNFYNLCRVLAQV